MKLRFAILSAVLLASPTAPPASARLQPEAVSYQKLTIDATVGGVGISAATRIPGSSTNHVTLCSGTLETAEVRARHDGGTVTTAEGTVISIGSWVEIRGRGNIENWRGIRTGATSGVLPLHCYR